MLRALIICPDDARKRDLEVTLGRVADLEVARSLAEYPSPTDLLRTIRLRDIQILFLDVDRLGLARELAGAADRMLPGFPVITVGGPRSLEALPELMHVGVRDHLVAPFPQQAALEAVQAAIQRLTAHPVVAPSPASIFSFLPAKPGVGTSTIAVSASCAAAENLEMRTLLIDCDLAAGAIRFLLKLGNSSSLVDAISHSEALDENMWDQVIGRWDKLDVLQAGRLEPPPNPDLRGMERVLAMARNQYEVVCADLPSSIDPLSVTVMRESRRIFLVTTPEVVPLHLAAARLRRLGELGLGDRVSLLLNRKTKSGFSDNEVAQAVGIPVDRTFSNDYPTVTNSILRATPVSQESALGHSILDLARSFSPHAQTKPVARGTKFLEFFHIPHAHEVEHV